MHGLPISFLIASCFFIGVAPTFCQGEQWKPVEGPYGGTFNYFAFSPVDSKTIFTGLGLGFADSPVYMSRDGGVSWKLMPVDGVVRVNPRNPNNVFVFGTGAWSSDDLGDTWEKVSQDEREQFLYSDVEFSSTAAETIYAAHAGWVPPSEERFGQYVSRSTDSGRTWTKLATLGYLRDTAFMQLELSPQPEILFAQLPNGKVLKSTDGGFHWKTASRGIPLTSHHLRPPQPQWMLVLDKKQPSILYTAGPKGLYRTTDGGSLWQKVDLECDDCVPKSVSIDPFDDRTIYECGVGSLKAMKSTDFGKTWEPLPIPQYPGLPFLAVAVSPQSRNLMLAGLTSRGILRSVNGGGSWNLSNHGIRELAANDPVADPRRPGALTVIGRPRDGESPTIPLFSFNYGKSWSYNPDLGGISPDSLVIHGWDSNFRVLSGEHLAVTTDGGKRWAVGTFPENGHCGKPQLGGKGKVIFCLSGSGDRDGPIVRSTDLGKSWTAFGPPLPSSDDDVGGFALDPKNNNIIYTVVHAYTFDSPPPDRIERTTDGGRTWTTLKNPPGGEIVIEFHVHPRNPKLMYMSTAGGIFKSTDGGTTWMNVAPGFQVHSITLDPKDPAQLFAVRAEMWRTTDGGTTWKQLTQNGLPNGPPTADLMVSPWDPNILYGATNRGLYYLKMD